MIRQRKTRRGAMRRSRKRQVHRRMLYAAAGLLCLLLLAAGALKMMDYIQSSRRTAQVNAALQSSYAAASDAGQDTKAAPAFEPGAYQHIADEMLPESAQMYAANPDFVGWMHLPGVFDLPVVYRDNEYYLNHDFYGRESDSGTLFLDEGHPLSPYSQYLLVHGHNMFDGSMLGKITHFRYRSYIQEHPRLYFNTLYRREEYEIIGVLQVTEEEMYSLLRMGLPSFASDAEFLSFIETLRSHALHFTEKEILPGDAILSIATCWEDGRFVLLLRRM